MDQSAESNRLDVLFSYASLTGTSILHTTSRPQKALQDSL